MPGFLYSAESRCRLYPMVFAYNYSVSTIEICVPVLGGCDSFKSVELPNVFEALVNELPGTLPVRPDLTAVLSGAAARAVEQPFGATSNGTNAPVFA